MASKKLVRLAKAAAKAQAKASTAQRAWVEAFEAEYGCTAGLASTTTAPRQLRALAVAL